MADEPQTLAPTLLVAMPQLLDPNFRRAVVLLVAHGPEGAMGFVLNRRLPASVPELLEGMEIPWQGEADVPLFAGGPVLPETGWVLFDRDREELPDSQEVLPGLMLTASAANLRTLAGRPPKRFRLMLGYAGWGPGQLEDELTESSWLVVQPEERLIFDVPAESAWSAAIRTLGIDPESLVPGHGVQ